MTCSLRRTHREEPWRKRWPQHQAPRKSLRWGKGQSRRSRGSKAEMKWSRNRARVQKNSKSAPLRRHQLTIQPSHGIRRSSPNRHGRLQHPKQKKITGRRCTNINQTLRLQVPTKRKRQIQAPLWIKAPSWTTLPRRNKEMPMVSPGRRTRTVKPIKSNLLRDRGQIWKIWLKINMPQSRLANEQASQRHPRASSEAATTSLYTASTTRFRNKKTKWHQQGRKTDIINRGRKRHKKSSRLRSQWRNKISHISQYSNQQRLLMMGMPLSHEWGTRLTKQVLRI